MTEQHLYIPPDVSLEDDGRVVQADWNKVYRMDTSPDRILLSFTGMGMPDVNYITQSGPGQPGETILDFTLNPRYIQYVHARTGCSRQDYWDNRLNIGTLLSPARQLATAQTYKEGRLRVVLPNGTKRDINAVIDRGPIFSARDPKRWSEYTFVETIRFRCPDPTWFNPDINEVEWETEIYDGLIFYEPTNYTDRLTFPTNAIFGADIISAGTSIIYNGTWFGYPIIEIVGPISSPIIQNTTLNQKIALNYDVANGETVTIITEYGKKGVTNNFGDNLIGTLTNDSSLKFFLAHDPWATDGINNLEGSGSGADENTKIKILYYTRYIMI